MASSTTSSDWSVSFVSLFASTRFLKSCNLIWNLSFDRNISSPVGALYFDILSKASSVSSNLFFRSSPTLTCVSILFVTKVIVRNKHKRTQTDLPKKVLTLFGLRLELYQGPVNNVWTISSVRHVRYSNYARRPQRNGQKKQTWFTW